MKQVSGMLTGLAAQRPMNLAFLDQVMVSGANFLAGILMARTLGLYEFGRFTLAWMLIEFMGSLQFAAVIQPMLNIGPKHAEADSDCYYDAVAAQQGIACLVFGTLGWFGITVAGWLSSDPELHGLAMPLCIAVISYQLHNFFRRYFFARDRALAALCNDALRYATLIAALVALPVAWPGATAVAATWIVASACLASVVQGAFFFGGVRWNPLVFRSVWMRHWNFSKWLLPSAVMHWMTSQAFVVMSGFVLGAAATGALKAAISVTGVLNILLLALDNFAPVQAARAFHSGGPRELRRYLSRLACLTGILIVGTVAILNIDPGYIVHVLFGDQYQGITHLVRWFCAPAAVYGLSSVLVIWAAAMEWTRIVFLSYAVATAFTVVAAYPLTLHGGLAGVALGSLLVEIIRVAVLWVPLARSTIATTFSTSESA